MSTIEITSKIEALKDLESLIEEAKAEAEALRDEIKSEIEPILTDIYGDCKISVLPATESEQSTARQAASIG